LIGLSLAGFGCAMFYPAAELREFWLFLMSLFVLASGITVLQVAANPYVAVLGNPEKAASRLNLAQAFNSLGTTIAPILSASYLLSDTILTGNQVDKLDGVAKEAYYAAEAGAVQIPFWFGRVLLLVSPHIGSSVIASDSRRNEGQFWII